MIKRLAHICFRTNRFQEMTAFYREKLGLPQQFTMDRPDGTVFGRYFALGERSFLELFDDAGAAATWGGEPVHRQPAPHSFYQHFCLEIEGLDSFRQTLIDNGVEVTAIKTGMDGSRQCWIKDPDANSIELMEYTGASKQLNPAIG